MTTTTIRHELDSAEAKRRVKARIGSYAAEYGLKVRWSGDELNVSGKGVTASASFEPGRVAIELDKAWYIPLSERRILDGIKSELSAALR